MRNDQVMALYRDHCCGLSVKSTAKGSNVSFNGHDFYSYSAHIARYYPQQDVLLLTATAYSQTTHRHVDKLVRQFEGSRYAYQTNPDTLPIRCFRVPDIINPSNPANAQHLALLTKQHLEAAVKAKVYQKYHYDFYNALRKATEDYVEMFECGFDAASLEVDSLLNAKQIAKLVVHKLDGRLSNDGGIPHWRQFHGVIGYAQPL